MKKLTVILIAVLLAFAMAACGSTGTESGSEEGQKSAADFVGDYSADRATIHFEAEGTDGAKATVLWGSSYKENSEWVMSGTFDAKTGTFEYHDCTKTDYVYKENGDVESSEEVYVGGHGFMFFKEGDPAEVTWQEDQEHVADGMTFTSVE